MRIFLPFLISLLSYVTVFAGTNIPLNDGALTDVKMNADYDIPWMGTMVKDVNFTESAFVKAYLDTYLNESISFVETKRQEDNIGMVHIRFQQFAHGLEMEHGTLILHMRNGRVESFNGEIYPVPDLPKSILTFQEALTKYRNDHPIDAP